MLAIISPAKALDFDSAPQTDQFTKPDFMTDAKKLIEVMRTKSEGEIMELMSISEKLAALNAQRYKDFKPPFTQDNAKQALLAFNGDVYQGFQLDKFTEDDFAYAQEHLRILSGLYGLLRPLDLIQPYRLEMGTKLKTDRGKDLYEFWGKSITKALNKALAASGSDILINLASNEYYGSVQEKEVVGRIITPSFMDMKNGKYKIISFFAKKARGAMSDYLIRKRVDDLGKLKRFKWEGYAYNKDLTKGDNLVFTRNQES